MRTHVAATRTMASPEPATALLQIAVAAPTSERLTVLSGGEPVAPEEFEVDGAPGDLPVPDDAPFPLP